jgi:hypothetical protein
VTELHLARGQCIRLKGKADDKTFRSRERERERERESESESEKER